MLAEIYQSVLGVKSTGPPSGYKRHTMKLIGAAILRVMTE
jgi:hypothetical protein